mmetsp:Transcript_11526/g.30820  ORF Transcript_11526/g.30820 Transcript_11526/m.30820 type:complete len:212 (+) Transcript_11526:379-1014(+)
MTVSPYFMPKLKKWIWHAARTQNVATQPRKSQLRRSSVLFITDATINPAVVLERIDAYHAHVAEIIVNWKADKHGVLCQRDRARIAIQVRNDADVRSENNVQRLMSVETTMCTVSWWYSLGPNLITQMQPVTRRQDAPKQFRDTGSPKYRRAIARATTMFQPSITAAMHCGARPRPSQLTTLPAIQMKPPTSQRPCIQYGEGASVPAEPLA